jgi:hypothetical protein
MRSAAIQNALKNQRSNHATPHNATLRIIRAANVDAVAGALSFERLASATMRTPLACKLSVTISPWKSLPTFLKEPMLAMSLLLFVFRARDHRGLDGDLQAEDDRRCTRSGRSAAEDAGVKTFLPREEWALAQGKKVLSDGVAAQAIEA